MNSNETTLHKLASVITTVDDGVTDAVSWVDRYSEWLAWGAVVLVVILIFTCFICHVIRCGMCMFTHGKRVICCCRRSTSYTRQNDSEC